MRPLTLLSLVLVVSVLTGCGKPEPLPAPNQESAVAFVQPATVKVIAFGDVEGSYPRGAYLRTTAATFGNDWYGYAPTESVIQAEYRRDQESGTVAYGSSYQDYAWRKIAERPGDYLFHDILRDTVSMEQMPYGIGSGVVVSEDGVIVTCQHVIEDSNAVSAEFVFPAVDAVYNYLVGEFGGEPSDEVINAVASSLIGFVMQDAQFSVTFREARVFFPLEWDGKTFDRPDAVEEPFAAFFETGNPEIERLKNWTYPCDVLAEGASYPGKDVAVLKARDVSGLIAADLAADDTVSQGEMLHTLGFPGAAIITGMTEAASYLAVYHSGRVGQIMPMSDGWRAIHFDADINHGDSGGPVFDSTGALVGLNVAGNPDAPGQNLAVPISLVREILTANGIEVKSGESTKKWRDAVLLMQGNRNAEAQTKLEELAKEINVSQALLSLQFSGPVAQKVANKYVQERLDQCRAATKSK
jgi:S1-C subfamily serine protease